MPELVLLVTLAVQAGRGEQALPLPNLPFRVIVNSANGVTSLSRGQLSAIFMKRTRAWPDRSEIIPVDHGTNSRLRDRFSRAVHGKSVLFVSRYWQRLIFSGRGIPPMELGSSAAVVEFVKANRGAIGYVDVGIPLDDQVKVVTVTR